MDGTSPRPRYSIGAVRHANFRLDDQFYRIQALLNNQLLDPRIPHAQMPNLKVADVCCGTGVWLLSLISSKKLHPTTEFHGFDINLSNLPPAPWMPGIVQHMYNVFDEPPTELWSKFDIVNVSLACTFVNDKLIDNVLSNILKLVKPGGWLQWIELDLASIQIFFPNPTLSEETVQELEKVCPGAFELFGAQLSTWISHLEALYEESDMRSLYNTSSVESLTDQSTIKEWVKQFPAQSLDEEAMTSVLSMLQDTPENRRKLKAIRDFFMEAYRESDNCMPEQTLHYTNTSQAPSPSKHQECILSSMLIGVSMEHDQQPGLRVLSQFSQAQSKT